MVDEEVEIVLREIRERVLSKPPPAQTTSAVAQAVTENGADDFPLTGGEGNETTPAALALIGSYLTTTARAWSRLPPIVSQRRGAAARLELWIKSRSKSLTGWFTWEQVNFNAAAHQALRDIIEVLSDMSVQIETLRIELEQHQIETGKLRAESEARRIELEQHRIETDKLWAQSEARRIELEQHRIETDKLRVQSEARRIELEQHLIETDKLRAEWEARRIEKAALRAMAEAQRIQTADEVRVCIKQLSLEISEAVAFADRARCKGEVLLEELARRLEELENTLARGK